MVEARATKKSVHAEQVGSWQQVDKVNHSCWVEMPPNQPEQEARKAANDNDKGIREGRRQG